MLHLQIESFFKLYTIVFFLFMPGLNCSALNYIHQCLYFFTCFCLCRFDIIKKLGQGTYGKVQLGINKETGQEVAIKTIKKSKIESEADLVRIRREIQIMSSVQHPNIIHIYEGSYLNHYFFDLGYKLFYDSVRES